MYLQPPKSCKVQSKIIIILAAKVEKGPRPFVWLYVLRPLLVARKAPRRDRFDIPALSSDLFSGLILFSP